MENVRQQILRVCLSDIKKTNQDYLKMLWETNIQDYNVFGKRKRAKCYTDSSNQTLLKEREGSVSLFWFLMIENSLKVAENLYEVD